MTRQKYGRHTGSKDKYPRKRNELNKQVGTIKVTNSPKNLIIQRHVVDIIEQLSLENDQVTKNVENNEISIWYTSTKNKWNKEEEEEEVVISDIFACALAIVIMEESEDLEPK